MILIYNQRRLFPILIILSGYIVRYVRDGLFDCIGGGGQLEKWKNVVGYKDYTSDSKTYFRENDRNKITNEG